MSKLIIVMLLRLVLCKMRVRIFKKLKKNLSICFLVNTVLNADDILF